VKLSLRQKQNFYYELGQRLRSGIAFPTAVQTMAADASGNLRKFAADLRARVDRGETVAAAFAGTKPAVGDLEVGIVEACERSGKIDNACRYLSEYFGTLAQAKALVLKKSAYPFFILHFGIFVLAVPKLFLGGSLESYLRQTAGFLAIIYAIGFALFLALRLLIRAGARSETIDAILRAVPVVGGVRRSFSLARFCATYEMQLQASVNIIDSLMSAAIASQSGLVVHAAQRAVPNIREGAQVGSELAKSRAFPPAMIRAMRLGEDTGQLDAELMRLTVDFQREALTRVDTVSDWLPKIAYVAIVVYLAYQIADVYRGVLQSYSTILDS
jgi:type II secretory pathway component PulF